jgi:hypothetical protein
MSNAILTLAQELAESGFVPGAPSHIPPSYLEIDRRVYRKQRCSECGQRGQKSNRCSAD